jgi:para-nitrobenzyl esterase
MRRAPSSTDAEAKTASNDSARDQTRVSMYLWAMERARTGKTKAYTYFYTHPMPGPDIAQFGAFHTSEVPYVLNTLAMSNRPFTPADHRIADTMSSYFVNFTRSGDPNGKGLPEWPAVSGDTAVTMELGERFAPMPVAGTAAKLSFFRSVLLPAPATSTAASR